MLETFPISTSKNRFKVNSHQSPYRLYVEFLEPFAQPRKHFNYYCNFRYSEARELENLKRRVLLGTCFGRYKRAMLFRQSTNECLAVWMPGQLEMTYAEYQAQFHAQKSSKKSLLKMMVICEDSYQIKLLQAKKKHPLYFYSAGHEPLTNVGGYDFAVYHFRQILLESQLQPHFRFAVLYRLSDGAKVALINRLGHLTFYEDDFGKTLQQSTRIRLHQLGVFNEK